MRASSFGFLIAIAGLATIPVATPSRAGGLQDLVGYGAQDVYLSPPATEAPAGATAAPADAAVAPEETAAAPDDGADAKGQDDAGGATAHPTRKPKPLRLSKDCRKAGLKTREECDAFHATQAKKPADKVLPADAAGAATADASQPDSAATGLTPVGPAGDVPVLKIMNGMGGAAYSN